MKKTIALLAIAAMISCTACQKEHPDNYNYLVRLTYIDDSREEVFVPIEGRDSWQTTAVQHGQCFYITGTSGRHYGTRCGVRSYTIVEQYIINK